MYAIHSFYINFFILDFGILPNVDLSKTRLSLRIIFFAIFPSLTFFSKTAASKQDLHFINGEACQM